MVPVVSAKTAGTGELFRCLGRLQPVTELLRYTENAYLRVREVEVYFRGFTE